MPKVPLTPIWRTRSGSTRLYKGDVRDVLGRLPEQSVHCMVTSPPYWGLRDYGVATVVRTAPRATPERGLTDRLYPPVRCRNASALEARSEPD